MIKNLRICLILILTSAASVVAMEKADSVYRNGAIYTVNDQQPWAQAIAVKDKRIIYVGDNTSVKNYIGKRTNVTDLKGSMVMPGIHDAHTHLLWAGQRKKYWCNLPAGPMGDPFFSKLKECASELESSEWLVAGLFFSEQFPDSKPDRAYLDTLFPDIPVFIHEGSLHNALVNSKALELSGIDESTLSPFGGELVKDSNGRLTGELIETATGLVTKNIPLYSPEENRMALERAIEICNENGITSVQDASTDREFLELTSAMDTGPGLSLNVAAHLIWGSPKFNRVSAEEVEILIAERDRYDSEHVDVNNIKMWIDGTPTAPYFTNSDIDQKTGEPEFERILIAPSILNDAVTRFDKMGMKVKLHASGQGAVHVALDAIEQAKRLNPNSNIVHDLGHTNLVLESDMTRMRVLNVIGEVSPSVWHLYGSTLGDPPQSAWSFRTLLNKGIMLTVGTDWVVSDTPNMFPALQGMLFHGDESIDLISAIRALTINGAIATGRGKESGTIEVGKFANLAVLDQNLFDIELNQIGETKVNMTIFEGSVVYKAE